MEQKVVKTQTEKMQERVDYLLSIPKRCREFEEECELRSLSTRLYYIRLSVR